MAPPQTDFHQRNSALRTVAAHNAFAIGWRGGTLKDPVEAPLFGALLQSEIWADHYALQRCRKLAGRYRILSAAGIQNRQPEGGFEQLRRARDAKAIRKA